MAVLVNGPSYTLPGTLPIDRKVLLTLDRNGLVDLALRQQARSKS